MCLSSVSKKVDGTSMLIEGGWKHFKGPNIDEFPYSHWGKEMNCPLDKWITAIDDKSASPQYEIGFHIFTDEQKAKKDLSKIRRVYFRRVTAIGIDQGIETIVAQEMYVPSREDAWPPQQKG